MIEARIIEANRTFSNEIGIVWGFQGVADAAHGNTTGLVFPNSGSVAGNVSVPAARRRSCSSRSRTSSTRSAWTPRSTRPSRAAS